MSHELVVQRLLCHTLLAVSAHELVMSECSKTNAAMFAVCLKCPCGEVLLRRVKLSASGDAGKMDMLR